MPTFSVIIPTYNSEAFIERTITSVLAQSFNDFEIIIVDDGSTDTTVSIIQELCEHDSRIKLLTIKNSGGAATPTNKGIECARGKYIAFLDHDDRWKPEKLEIVLRTFQEHKSIGFVASDVEIFNESTGTTKKTNVSFRTTGLSTSDMLAGNYFNTMSMLVIKHEVLHQIGGLDPSITIFGDYDLIVRMLSHNIHYAYLKEPLTLYTVHNNNTSGIERSKEKRIHDLLLITKKYHSKFSEYHKSLSIIFRAVGELYLGLNKKQEALKAFSKSITYDHANPLAYIRFLIAHLGKKPYRYLSRIKREVL